MLVKLKEFPFDDKRMSKNKMLVKMQQEIKPTHFPFKIRGSEHVKTIFPQKNTSANEAHREEEQEYERATFENVASCAFLIVRKHTPHTKLDALILKWA